MDAISWVLFIGVIVYIISGVGAMVMALLGERPTQFRNESLRQKEIKNAEWETSPEEGLAFIKKVNEMSDKEIDRFIR